MKTSRSGKKSSPLVATALREHFGTDDLHKLVTTSRVFPSTARVDMQGALDEVLKDGYVLAHQFGVHAAMSHETLTFSALATDHDYSPTIGPLQFDEVDVGADAPVRCVKNSLWLGTAQGQKLAVVMTPAEKFGRSQGLHVEMALMPGISGADLSRRFFAEIERIISQARSYRGKVISLEQSDNYTGHSAGVKVHKLRAVTREQVILPPRTLRLLESNVTDFIQQRQRLSALRMGVKKGLLFYGPPGTGKTHTIQYLASQLPDHTTLLITAEQVGLLDEYMQLARFLQPAMIVIEDVDLIARSRTQMHSPCEESLLNKLLNEMDGLREEAELLFVLTTNRPQELEAALASRPGRIDQAIEFPLPDDEGRRKLVHLYAGGLRISDEVTNALVRKTSNSSAAFIKELMRRSAQFLVQEDATSELQLNHVESALDEMLFAGGTLNVKLLGGAQTPNSDN
jgi:hypothetical protein